MARTGTQRDTVTFRIDPELKEELIKIADQDHKSLGELMRELARARVAQAERRAFEDEARRQCREIAAAYEAGGDEADITRWSEEAADTRDWKP
ncbi:MAG: ribbon-helix-helix protein, CopG family [Gammaproteobacteria bacterium]|nr:ribbon-helix-helix protein, CopG family [Gammaproteobacteria bacterium]